MENLDKKTRLLELIKHFADGKQKSFADFLAISPQTVNTWLRRGTLDFELLYSKCNGVSPEWLITGVGNMLKDESSIRSEYPKKKDFVETEIENPPIIPTSLSRKQNVDILEVVQESTDGMEICPVRVDDMPISVWHRVRDNSLEPELRKDDKIALHAYPLGEEDPMPGLLYGINTRTNGMILRRLYPHPDGYIGRSYNREDFPDVVIPYNNIIRIYRALLQVRSL